MHRSYLLTLLSILCLLTPFTVRTQTDVAAAVSDVANGVSDVATAVASDVAAAASDVAAGVSDVAQVSDTAAATGPAQVSDTAAATGPAQVSDTAAAAPASDTAAAAGSNMAGSSDMASEPMMSDMSDTETSAGAVGAAGNSTSGAATPSTFPTALLTTYAVDIHFLAVDPSVQYIAYHYCSSLSADYLQCAVYNSTDNTSRLAAVELICSEATFQTLSMDEKRLWHSHAFPIQNGLFVIPGLPADQEEATYTALAATYGKVIDFWHSFQSFPLGAPKLAYGLGSADQINATIANQLDQVLMLDTTWEERQQQRMGWNIPNATEGSNDYLTSGVFPQFVTQNFTVGGDISGAGIQPSS